MLIAKSIISRCIVQVTALDDACVFYLASLPRETFELMEEIFNLFNKGELKGQKIKRKSKEKALELKGTSIHIKFSIIIHYKLPHTQPVTSRP